MAEAELRVNVEKVRKLREGMGLSQYKAAAAAGFASRETWTMIETGTQGVTVKNLGRIATVLGVNPCDLLTNSLPRHARPKKGRP